MSGTEGWSRIVYSKDERGVIVDSKVIGADEDMPEGFSGSAEYTPIYDVRADHQEPVAESKLTPWDTPTGPSSKVAKSSYEVSDGTPRQAREQAGEDLTGAEEEADELLDEGSEEDDSDELDEVDEGTPRQAREQAGEDLTGAEEEADELSGESDDDGPPPQGGPGSGKESWAQYAANKGVSVPQTATRDEIVAAVKKAGHPV